MNKQTKPLFHPTFGSRPERIVGREVLLEEFRAGLGEPIGSRERCRLYYGQRGMGKTALLLEMEEIAKDEGFVTAKVTHYEQMAEDIIEILQRNGAAFVSDGKRKVTGVSLGGLGFSAGLTFSPEINEQYGFRSKLAMIAEALAQYDKGVLLLIDEVKSSRAMRQIATVYQELVGEDCNIAIVMAGLPHAVSSVLNDDVLTFLNRAVKVPVGPIREEAVFNYYNDAFSSLGVPLAYEDLVQATLATEGFPYLMQLIGYYISKDEGETMLVQRAIARAKGDLIENVFRPILAPLSAGDVAFLKAMAKNGEQVSVAEVAATMKKPSTYVQPYRKRLLEAGVIEAPRHGEVAFAVPYLGAYLRKEEGMVQEEMFVYR